MADEDSWLQETVIEFLRGPCYKNPLMGFIDEKCIIFDNDDENKLEYTQVHGEFKEVVDSLITDFLEDIGVTHEQFVETVAKNLNGDNINSFVVSSILTVEDFVQFKAMMVKRNLDLTNQVLGLIEDEHMSKVMEAHQNYMSEVSKLDGMTDEDMLAEAMKLSTMQFGAPGMDDDIAAALKASSHDEDAEFSEEFKQALALSMKEQSALDLEKAELEQALALSIALEQEQQRLAAVEASAAAAAPPAAAVPAAKAAPAAAPPPAAAPVAQASPPVPAPAAPAPAAAAPAFKASAAPPAAAPAAPAAADPASKAPAAAPEPVLNPIAPKAAPTPPGVSPYLQPAAAAAAAPPAMNSSGSSLPDTASLPAVGMGVGTKVLRGAAGYSSSAANSTADFAAIREAAAQAAKAQKGMLMARKQAVSEKADAAASSAGQVSEMERQRREAYLKKQREALLDMQRVKREEEMNSYLKEHQRAPRPAAEQAPDKTAEMDAKRAELRNNLAQQIKLQMIAKQADMSTSSS